MMLIERESSGVGQWVHTSLLEAQIFMLDFQASRWLIAGEVAKQAGNDHPTGIPTGLFPTSDGQINIAASGDHMFRRFCEAADAMALLDDPDYATGVERSKHRKALNERIAEITKRRPSIYWVELMNEVGVPCGPVYTIDQTFADPQVQHLEMARPVDHPKLGPIKVVGQAINMTARLHRGTKIGEIVVTNTFFQQLDPEMQAGFDELGLVEAKNIGTIRAWQANLSKLRRPGYG